MRVPGETDEEAWQQLLQNRALLDEEYEQRSVKVEELQSAWRTAELAASNARDSATAAREEVAAEAAVRACREAQATRASELRGQWEAERAQLVAQKAAWSKAGRSPTRRKPRRRAMKIAPTISTVTLR